MRSLHGGRSTDLFEDKALDLIGLDELDEGTGLEVEYPDSIAVTDVLVLEFLSCLEESDGDLLFLLFRGGPGIEDRLLLEVEVVVLDLKSLIDLDIEKGSRVEGDVDVDVLLIIEATFQIEDAELGGYF